MDSPMVVFVMKLTAVIQLLQNGKKVLCYQLDIEKHILTESSVIMKAISP